MTSRPGGSDGKRGRRPAPRSSRARPGITPEMTSTTKPVTVDISHGRRPSSSTLTPVESAPTVDVSGKIAREGTLQEQLDLAVQIENVAGRIYAVLAERFADEPEARALFTRLEQEEQQHALRIEMLGTTLARRPELQRQLVLDVEKLQRALKEGEDVARLLAEPRPRIPLDRARRLAAQLEEKFSGVHAEQITSCSEPSLRELFSIFVAQDRGHAALLRGTKL
jgi:rubrerythrin